MLLEKRKFCLKLIYDIFKQYEQEAKKNIPIVLDDKIDEFIMWYENNIIKNNYTENGAYYNNLKLKNIIEKMAVWYELRYPDYEVNRKMKSSYEPKNISDIMFNQNKYINEQLDDESEIRVLDWDEFYNTNTFIKSLTFNEKKFFSKPRYPSFFELTINGMKQYYHLTANGYIRDWNDSKKITICDKNRNYFSFYDINIEEFLLFLKNGNFELSQNQIMRIEIMIKHYKNRCYAKDEFLNCVMYRIIERGGTRIGPRRAFMFAKEFNRNIDIPMIYGIDCFDPGLRLFINEYIKSGGSKDLVCYVNYLLRETKYEKLDVVTIQELINTISHYAGKFYTPEESELHQRLVNSLSSQIRQNKLIKKKKFNIPK